MGLPWGMGLGPAQSTGVAWGGVGLALAWAAAAWGRMGVGLQDPRGRTGLPNSKSKTSAPWGLQSRLGHVGGQGSYYAICGLAGPNATYPFLSCADHHMRPFRTPVLSWRVALECSCSPPAWRPPTHPNLAFAFS
jgi:hypothetical protein